MSYNHSLTDAVVDRLAQCQDPRFKQVLTSLIRHLHSFVREVEPTEAEWLQAIRFLAQTGQACDDKRQEFILLSDVLGVTMLVDSINHSQHSVATDSTILGPFYVAQSPETPMWGNIAEGLAGIPCFISGVIRDTDGHPVEGVQLDVWQTDGVDGVYDVQIPNSDRIFGRGRLRSDAQGRYAFRSVKPISYMIPTDGPVGGLLERMGRHAWRPAHVHTMLQHPAFQGLTTHLFVKGDPWIESDAVFGVKDSLVVDFVDHPAGPTPDGSNSDVPFSVVNFDFVISRKQ